MEINTHAIGATSANNSVLSKKGNSISTVINVLVNLTSVLNDTASAVNNTLASLKRRHARQEGDNGQTKRVRTGTDTRRRGNKVSDFSSSLIKFVDEIRQYEFQLPSRYADKISMGDRVCSVCFAYGGDEDKKLKKHFTNTHIRDRAGQKYFRYFYDIYEEVDLKSICISCDGKYIRVFNTGNSDSVQTNEKAKTGTKEHIPIMESSPSGRFSKICKFLLPPEIDIKGLVEVSVSRSGSEMKLNFNFPMLIEEKDLAHFCNKMCRIFNYPRHSPHYFGVFTDKDCTLKKVDVDFLVKKILEQEESNRTSNKSDVTNQETKPNPHDENADSKFNDEQEEESEKLIDKNQNLGEDDEEDEYEEEVEYCKSENTDDFDNDNNSLASSLASDK